MAQSILLGYCEDEDMQIDCILVGGDWNHGMDYDFPYIGNHIGNNHPN